MNIFFVNGVGHFHDFFLKKLEYSFLDDNIYYFNIKDKNNSMYKLIQILKTNEPIVIVTYNFVGIGDLWFRNTINKYPNCLVLNLLMDAPYYYYQKLRIWNCPRNIIHMPVDKYHTDWINNYYNMKAIYFPLGGATSNIDINFSNRKYDVLFTGSLYNNKVSTNSQKKWFDELRDNVDLQLSDLMEKYYGKYDIDIISNYSEVDVSIRGYYRKKLIDVIHNINPKYKIALVGNGWDKNNYTDNVESIKFINNTQDVVDMSANAKISINMLPWFKYGGHDRLFNSCLTGSLCFSDMNKYLDKYYKDKENIITYQLSELDTLADKINYYLEHQDEAEQIALKGKEITMSNHTWEIRSKELKEIINAHFINGKCYL